MKPETVSSIVCYKTFKLFNVLICDKYHPAGLIANQMYTCVAMTLPKVLALFTSYTVSLLCC